MRIKNNPNIKIGNKLKQARVACGYTQEKVAEIINCSSRYIGQLETNISFGSISLIIELCNLYNTTLNDIYSDFIKADKLNDTETIFGYKQLSDEYKKIVDNNISFLNSLQNEKDSTSE